MALFKRDVHHNYYEDHEAARMREERLAEEAEEERELQKKQLEMEMAMKDFNAYKRYKKEQRKDVIRKVLLTIIILAGLIIVFIVLNRLAQAGIIS